MIARDELGRLTRRQRQIIGLIAQGLTRKEIALQLRTHEKTVHYHMSNARESGVHQRLGYSDAARLTHFAIRAGLIKLGQVATS